MRKFWTILSGALIIVFSAGSGGQEPKVQTASFQPSSIPGSAALKIDQDFGKMPLYFIPNQGQMDARVAYYLQGKDKTIYFTSEGLTYVLSERSAGEEIAEKTASEKERLFINPAERELQSRRDQGRYAVKLDFVGANADVRPSGEEKTGAVISYFKGKPEEWKAGLPTYSRIVYKNLWPGIDVAYYGTTDKMKYEFIVHPGSDPSLIRLAYRGVSAVEVNGEGRLEVRTPVGGFEDDRPVGYQEINGDRIDVALKYLLEEQSAKDVGPGGEEAVAKSYVYGFEVGDYDRTKPLVLDPVVLVYCGYIGGSDWEVGKGMAVDISGNAYVAGLTYSTEATFPDIGGPDLTHNGGSFDAFVAKVNAAGTVLVYCGYIGGSGSDYGWDIAVDGSGNAYVTGGTYSTETTFPVIGGPDLTHNGDYDAFVAKVNTLGTALVYCGYIGGSDYEYGYGVAVDGSGNAYVAGYTESTQATFPVVVGPDLTYKGGNSDAFVAKVNASGTALVYCGYIGGSGGDEGYGIAVDSTGNAYVAGSTSSTEATFPVIGGPDLTHNGGYDAFVAKVYASGTALVYCGYIGGPGNDGGYSIAVDGSGNAYVTGSAGSAEAAFPVIGGPDLTYNGAGDAFVAKISSIPKDDFLGTWDSQGIYYRNSDTGAWVKMASPATLITAGDLGGDGVDDLIGIWPTQGGVWAKSSTNGAWTKLSTTAEHIAAGDMNGDGRVDFLGTWDGQGVYYRDSLSGVWVKMASPADLITAGDLDGDGIDDLLGIWPSQGGVWVKYSKTGAWSKLSSTAKDIAAGDMNGDGRDDLLATWDGQGVYYRNSMNGAWVKMATPADQVTCGDLDGDAKADLIGIWPTQGGVWVKYSETGSWAKLSSSARDIAAGKMRTGTAGSMPVQALFGPMGGYAQGPESLIQYQDTSSEGPGGLHFVYQTEELLIPQEHESGIMRIPGPGEPGFRCAEEKNLFPEESRESDATKEDRDRSTK